nr:MAG TPA: hypothetical protein [Caudoviricetes sp.]
MSIPLYAFFSFYHIVRLETIVALQYAVHIFVLICNTMLITRRYANGFPTQTR